MMYKNPRYYLNPGYVEPPKLGKKLVCHLRLTGKNWTISQVYGPAILKLQGRPKVGQQTPGHNSLKSEPIKKIFAGIFLVKFVNGY